MAKCAICQKEPVYGNKLSITRSHISKRSSRTWKPNLRTIKTEVNGTPMKLHVCSRCLRTLRKNEEA